MKKLNIACLILVLITGCAHIEEHGDKNVPDYEIAYLAHTDGFWQVWLTNVLGSRHRQLTHTKTDKARITWYPDGKHLLVGVRQKGLYRVDIFTGKEEKIVLPWEGVTDAAISPDGTHIAFSINPNGDTEMYHIWLADNRGKLIKKLTSLPYLQHQPAWGPKGEWIYFLSGKGGKEHNIFRVSVDGTKKEQVTVAQVYNFDISISKQGEMLFSSNRSERYKIWRKKPGEKAIQVTEGYAYDSQPDWSPSAEKIVFSSLRDGGRQNIWLKSLQTGDSRQLTHHKMGANSPAWRK